MLALVWVAEQGQTIGTELAYTYWRNKTTGGWEIGFIDNCASYNC